MKEGYFCSDDKAKARHGVPDSGDRRRVEVRSREGFMAARILRDSAPSSDCWYQGLSAREGE